MPAATFKQPLEQRISLCTLSEATPSKMASATCRRRRRQAAGLRLILLALHLMASAMAGTFTVDGEEYEVTVSEPATTPQLWDSLSVTPWFGSRALAEALAFEVKDRLGLVNIGFSGPLFVYGGDYDALVWASGANALSYGQATPPTIYAFALGDGGDKWRAFDPVTSSVLWVPQVGLDCRATCASTFMLAVSSYKPTDAMPNPPLLCANVGALLIDPSLTLPGSLAHDAYCFFLSEGYTQPLAANVSTGRPAEFDPNGCSSYLEGTSPNATDYLCGCVPPRKSVNGTPQKPWRWVPAGTANCNSGSAAFDGYFVPFICRVRATGLIGHLNTQNCGFPWAEDIRDCAFGRNFTQPASNFPAVLNMPPAKPDIPDCVYMTRTGVAGSTQAVAGWNNIDKLCIISSFKYFVYRWAKKGVTPNP